MSTLANAGKSDNGAAISNGKGSSSSKQRSAPVPSPYAQPFALSEQYKQERQAATSDATSHPSQPTPFAQDLSVKLICKECQIDPPNIVEEFASGDLACGDCGLIIGDRIVDTRSECEWCGREQALPRVNFDCGLLHAFAGLQGGRLRMKKETTLRVLVKRTIH